MNFDVLKRNIFGRRIFVIYLFKVIFMLAIAAKIGVMQIIHGNKYKLLAKLNGTKISFRPSVRGEITDINGKIIASNKKFSTVIFTDVPLKQSGIDTIREVYKLIYTDPQDVSAAVKKAISYHKNNPYVEIPIYKNQNIDIISKILFHIPDLPNVEIQEVSSRYYNFNQYFCHVVGYVRNATKSLIDKTQNILVKKMYRSPNYYLGYSGVESAEDQWLSGRCGVYGSDVNRVGNVRSSYLIKEPEAGGKITLSLDADLQVRLADNFGDKLGGGVVIDIKSGGILAMYSSPSFDPNVFVSSNDPNLVRNIIQDESGFFVNRCISGLYPPGSTFKTITAMTGVANGWDPSRQIYCNGTFDFAGRRYHCWKEGGHGKVDLNRAIAQSCNVYFYNMGLMVDIDDLYSCGHSFGLGQVYDLGIGKEQIGCLPNRSWKQDRLKQQWFKGDTLNSVIGQGYNQINILQLAVNAARIASGVAINPYIWHNFGKHHADGIYPEHADYLSKNHGQAKIDLSEAAIQAAKNGMYACVQEPYGSLFRFSSMYPKAKICGKSGTAQTVSKRIDAELMKGRSSGVASHGLFFGYAPYDDPRFSIAVVVERGIWGAVSAAPIAMDALNYMVTKNIA